MARKRSWITVPPLIIIGAVIILGAILLFVTLENIHRENENAENLLLERGSALIRSFEAGIRTGVLGMQWDSPQIRKWLTETAQQPGIFYLVVTDHTGKILAHSDPSKIGEQYETELDLESVTQSPLPTWRKKSESRGQEVFEIANKCSPLPGQLVTYIRTESPHEWLRLQISAKEGEEIARLAMVVGLDMAPIERARKEDIRNTILAALFLLLLGFAGIVSLTLAHGYRAARTTLTKIKAFSDTLVDNMPVGIIALDREELVTSINPTAELLLRTTRETSVGKPADKVIPGPIRKMTEELKRGEHITAHELECAVEPGLTLPLDVTATILEEDDGTFLGHVFLIRDLTEIRKLRREIERSQRLASLGRLAAGIAHEIRNPLSSIKGFATYFGERYRDVPEDRDTAQIMVEEVDRLNRVIGELLEFARPMNIQLRETSLPELVQHAVKLVEEQARDRNITLAVHAGSEIPAVPVDPDRFNQVLLNLYLNSIQAMEDGGLLTTNIIPNGPREVSIIVTDTGKGIPRKDLGKIFDPYFTTKPSGTGLGLAIVHRIIEAHEGTLRVESEPGKGTTVRISLPLQSGGVVNNRGV
ncbi:MAG: PAS domain-containing protein [Deltaproteobacteria bacterium]|nr:PAS domain-containing protein [Deltaproteobacteria bacterium]